MPEHAPHVEEVVHAWLAAKQSADADAIGRRLSSYEGVLAIGTDADEWWAGPARFREAHLSGGPFTASISALEAHRHGPVAWCSVDAVIDTGEPAGMAIRLTLVLVEEAGGWQIVQSHASTPAS